MNEHDMDQPEEIDPPSWALGASEHAGTEFVESMPGAQGNRPANVEAAPSPRHPKNAKETQGETRPESDRQLDLESMRGLASTLRASKSNSDHREICTERADQITPRKLRWLWPERIPLGKVTVFAGLPGQGKSLATVDIAARLTRGAEYPDVANPMPPSEVWLVAGEDDPEDVLVPRLLAADADLSKVHIQNSVRVNGQDDTLRLDVDAAGINRYLKDRPDLRLVVLDPVSNHLGDASMIDEQEVRAILVALADTAKARQVAIICVLHLNKKEGLSAIHRVSGAGAFIGVARASWFFAPDSEI